MAGYGLQLVLCKVSIVYDISQKQMHMIQGTYRGCHVNRFHGLGRLLTNWSQSKASFRVCREASL